jgi:hypothetical protein
MVVAPEFAFIFWTWKEPFYFKNIKLVVLSNFLDVKARRKLAFFDWLDEIQQKVFPFCNWMAVYKLIKEFSKSLLLKIIFSQTC